MNKLALLVLIAATSAGAGELDAADNERVYAMYLAMKHRCAELVPEKAEFYRNSRLMLEATEYHETKRIRETSPTFAESVKKALDELRKGDHLRASECTPDGFDTFLFVDPRNTKPVK